MQFPFSTIDDDAPNALVVAAAGLVALAVSIGIGRFAFTPILPMMIADSGLTLAAAGWLAAANYLGYLLGAMSAARVPLLFAIRGGMVLIAVVTFAMGVVHVFAVQMVLRLMAGMASAWILIHVSAWALAHLARANRTEASGVMFAGVGLGIAVAGLVCMGAMYLGWHSDVTWEVFGLLSLVAAILFWQPYRAHIEHSQPDKSTTKRIHWNVDKWRLMACYGAFGIGYIIPSTFLPNMAHQYVSDPLIFGLAWPIFGLAAALSTWVVARWLAACNDRKVWAVSHVLIAVGVILPVIWPALTAILIAALLVGGTFMIVVMLSLREARRSADADATPFIAAMTVAFAIGQIIGPLLVSVVAEWSWGFAVALLFSAAVLVLTAVSLWRSVQAPNVV